jgi:hypothetical protein
LTNEYVGQKRKRGNQPNNNEDARSKGRQRTNHPNAKVHHSTEEVKKDLSKILRKIIEKDGIDPENDESTKVEYTKAIKSVKRYLTQDTLPEMGDLFILFSIMKIPEDAYEAYLRYKNYFNETTSGTLAVAGENYFLE